MAEQLNWIKGRPKAGGSYWCYVAIDPCCVYSPDVKEIPPWEKRVMAVHNYDPDSYLEILAHAEMTSLPSPPNLGTISASTNG